MQPYNTELGTATKAIIAITKTTDAGTNIFITISSQN
jgi:hypothetical protein